MPRATNYRSAGLSQSNANQYAGNAFVYLLASRIDPNLCKIGKGNPTARCDHWNANSPHGGMLNNNLSVFAAYEFETEAQALECEAQAHALYNFVNLNPNAAGGEQEFFAVPPQQAEVALDLLHGQYVAQAQQAAAIAQARQDGYDNAPMVVAQREAAERAQREAEQAQREAAERAQREAAVRAQREAAVRAQIEAAQRAHREAAERAHREADEQAQREAAERVMAQELLSLLKTKVDNRGWFSRPIHDPALLHEFEFQNRKKYPAKLLPVWESNLFIYRRRLERLSQDGWLTYSQDPHSIKNYAII